MAAMWRSSALLALVWLASSANVMACRYIPQTLTIPQALTKADSVFVGTITTIEPGLPADFKPQAGSELTQRGAGDRGPLGFFKKAELPRGQTVIFTVERQWKGVAGKKITVLSAGDRSQSSCDAAYNLQRGDRMVVFAYLDGNYAVLPLTIVDPLSSYNRYDPASRHGKVAADNPYAEAIADETAWFQKILQELPQPPATP